MSESKPVTTRRHVLAAAGATIALQTGRALGQQPLGPPPHAKGPLVFLNYDQIELDAAYTQNVYEPTIAQVTARLTSNSEAVRKRIGQPQRKSYGSTEIEKLDVFRATQPKGPIFVFIHGGAWRSGIASDYSYIAELFVNAGAHCAIPDFSSVEDADHGLMTMADQVRRAIVWAYRNAESFGGDPARFYIGGHSSGAHLAGVALTTDWQKDFGLPRDFIRGGLCISGMYELKPVRLSSRDSYVKMNDSTEEALSPQRHLDQLNTNLVLAYGTFETPEFQRQTRDFAAAVKAAGKPVQLIVGENYAHMEMAESLGNPYAPMGRAALQLMKF